jgi:hypothetical protein
MKHVNSIDCDILRTLQVMMHNSNPYVNLYEKAIESIESK